MTSRKFWLTTIIILMNFFLLLLSKISMEIWMNICQWVLTVYVVGNVAQKFGVKE